MPPETIRILSIEDNVGDARLIEIMLAEATSLGWELPHFELVHASTLHAALARLSAEYFDAILTDLDLPDSQADNTFARLHAHAPHLPIVVLTGREDQALARRTIRASAEDYLFKREMNGSLLAHTLLYAIERQRAKATLLAAHDELERRVQERTTALEQANEQLRQEIAEHQRTAKALRKSQERYHSFVTHSHEAIYCTEFDQPVDISLPIEEQIDAIYQNAYMGECNQAMAEMYGLDSSEAFVGQRMLDFHGGKDNPVNRAVFRRFIESNYHTVDSETQEVAPDGTPRYFRSNDTGIIENGRLVRIWGVSVDITEQKQQKNALPDHHELIQGLFESLPVGVLLWDASGRLLQANRTFTAITGYTPEQVPTLEDWFPKAYPDPAYRTHVLDNWQHALQLPDAVREFQVTCKDGTVKNIEFRGIFLVSGRAIVTLADVTERKQAEAAFHERESMYRILFQDALNPVMMADQDGHYVDANEAALTFLECDRDELLARSVWDFSPPNLLERQQQEHAPFTGRRTLETEYLVHGVSKTLLLNVVPLRLRNQTILYGIGQDITAHKQAQETLVRQAEELARSNAALEQFAYTVSHDLNEPLRAVGGYLELLRHQYSHLLDDRGHEYLHYAADGAARMQSMIDALLRLSRIDSRGTEFAPTDCQVALAHALRNLQRSIQDSNAIITHDLLPTVMADATQLIQVFQNLVGNALKFRRAEEPPQVHISASIHSAPEKTGQRPGTNWLFSVQDNGIGLDMKQAGRLFEIFQRLHPRDKYEGSGIGLALCRRIVERHGGRIWVESTVGQGTTFYFTLPTAEASHATTGKNQ